MASDEPKRKIELSLDGGVNGGAASAGGGAGPQPEAKPVMGWIAVAFAVLGIVSWGVVFVPLGLVCSVIALFMGQGMWAFIGFGLSVVGLFSSPMLLGILGLGALAAYFGVSI